MLDAPVVYSWASRLCFWVFCPFCAASVYAASPEPQDPEAAAAAAASAMVAPAAASLQGHWTLGKIEPAVETAVTNGALADVVVNIGQSVADTGAGSVEEVGRIRTAAHLEQRVLSDQIRALDKLRRGAVSLNEQGERAAVSGNAKSSGLSSAQQAQFDTQLNSLRGELDANMDAMREAIGQAVARDHSSTKAAIVALVNQYGGTIRSQDLPTGIAATVPAAALIPLANYPMVASIVLDRPVDHELDNSVPSAGYGTWWDATVSVTGGVYDFGIIDTGVQQDHPALSGFGFYTNSGASTDSEASRGHGTHVTGIVASTDATYRGGAYGLESIIWSYSGSQSVTMANMHWQAAGPFQKPEVINHSLGYGSTAGETYSANDSFYDAFIDVYGIMVTKSAGNSGWGTTDSTVTFPGTAYNLLTIANMDDQNTASRADDLRRWSSSTGPITGGRKKPDITAPGTNILSANSSWATDSDFFSTSGTSMAAPHVAAGIILMEDGGNHIPMAQKAVLINTADAWTSNDTSSTEDDSQVAGSYWDKSYGWGYLDMTEAYFNRSDYFTGAVVGNNNNSAPDDYQLYKGKMFAGEKVTLVWHKRAEAYVAGAPATNPYALTDINLRFFEETSGTSLGADLGHLDNVHQVAASADVDAVIKVYAWSDTVDGASSEPYALATEENFTAVSPPTFEGVFSKPDWVGPYQVFTVSINARNVGGVAAHNVAVNMGSAVGFSAQEENNYGTIAAGGESAMPYTVTASGATAGSHVFPVQLSSVSYLETYTLDTSVTIGVETTPAVGSCGFSSQYADTRVLGVPWSAVDTQAGVKNNFLYAKGEIDSVFSYANVSSAGDSGEMINTVPADGFWEFAIRSQDNADNVEVIPVVADCSIFVDTVAPAIVMSSPPVVFGDAIPMSFTATDTASSSGVDYVDFWYKKLPNGNWTYATIIQDTMNGVVSFNPADGNGYYTIFARAADNAGNANINYFPGVGELGDTTTQWALVPDFDGDNITDDVDPDVDNDLLPDDWELANGFDPYDEVDGKADGDNDGRSNGEEYLDGGDWTIADTGDLNGDGLVDLADQLLAERYLIGKSSLDGASLSRGDFDRDGKLDLGDSLALQRFLLGN